jgi:hypothetical protein
MNWKCLMASVNIFTRCSKQGFICPWLNVSRLMPHDISHIILMPHDISHIILMTCAVVTDRGNDAVIRFLGSWRSLAMAAVNSYCCAEKRPRGEKDTARSVHHVDTWVPTLATRIKEKSIFWPCIARVKVFSFVSCRKRIALHRKHSKSDIAV